MTTYTMQALDSNNGHAIAASAICSFERHQHKFMQLASAYDAFAEEASGEMTEAGLAGAMKQLGLHFQDDDISFIVKQLDEDKSGRLDVT